MQDLTVYEVDVLTLLADFLPEGQRNALVEIPELQRRMPYADEHEVELTLQILDARGLVKYTPPITRGMAAIVSRPDPSPDVVPLRRRKRRSRRRAQRTV